MHGLVMLSAGLLLGASVATNVRCQEPPAVQAAGTPTALMVFIDYEGAVRPDLSPTELRVEAAHALAARISPDGQGVLSYPEIEPSMRVWGVRTAGDLSNDLLHALGAEYGIETVVLSRLVVFSDRLLLLSRGIDRKSGTVAWAEIDETSLSDDFWKPGHLDMERWRSAVAKLDPIGNRGPSGSGVDEAPTALVLPLRPFGLSPHSGELASHALLEALLSSNRFRIPDPSLVRNVLRAKGHDPSMLDVDGRNELLTWYEPSALLVPDLLTFETAPISSPTITEFGVEPADLSPVSSARSPLYFQVLAVDCATRQVRSADAVYLEPDDSVGLFGLTHHVPLARRFEKAAEEIVEQLQKRGGNL
ncbi:MAG: hypothetical protein R3E97_22425 [Candidatus Eisenbacteria bacterium]